MLRIINIIGRRGRFDLPTFLLTENECLTLKFTGIDPKLGRYVVTIRHGEDKKTVYLSHALTVDITAEWLLKNEAETVEISLELRDNAGTKILISSAKSSTDQQGYYIEPLKLEKTSAAWSMVAWLQKVESDIKKLGEEFEKSTQCLLRKIAKQDEKLEAITEKLKDYEENGVPLLLEENE